MQVELFDQRVVLDMQVLQHRKGIKVRIYAKKIVRIFISSINQDFDNFYQYFVPLEKFFAYVIITPTK